MKVLIADDDSTTRLVLSSLVERLGYETVTVCDGEAAWQEYEKDLSPCLMLIDWEMPILDGPQLCERIKQHSSLNPPYIILVTARTDPNDIVKGLEKGADDYICKPLNPAELMARIQVANRTLHLHQEFHQARKAMKYQATHDELTGLLNRRAALDTLSRELHRSERTGHDLHVAICDIDNFKRINDSYGHFTGDMVLKTVASTMQEVLRPYDLVARFGGEEFLIAIVDAEDSAYDAFERLRAEIAKRTISTPENEDINLTISIGAHSVRHDKTDIDMEEILVKADNLLYEAKRSGKNCVVSQAS
ncbi:MAG: diguanylate cyclase [Motiliproteus sp.]|nr:diguanylate cyclase [Motiliproteus sp.]MCW9054009.1 diguanylate cyclase [Motiliproteus sp.]